MRRGKPKKYSEEEDLKILAIMHNFSNLSITELAKLISENLPGRSVRAIEQRLYLKYKDFCNSKAQEKQFTDEEDVLILRTMNRIPTNYRLAFKEAALELNRTQMQIRDRWYKYLKFEALKNNSHASGVLGHSVYGSCKNIFEKNMEKQEPIFNLQLNGFTLNSLTSTYTHISF